PPNCSAVILLVDKLVFPTTASLPYILFKDEIISSRSSSSFLFLANLLQATELKQRLEKMNLTLFRLTFFFGIQSINFFLPTPNT
ncbi:MAG: hypothetical protein ACKN9A_01475, partial [Microcystis aeruginosa]